MLRYPADLDLTLFARRLSESALTPRARMAHCGLAWFPVMRKALRGKMGIR
ncbi:hypothetical protein thalar_02992 [Litoreibacter arenae DSM 19593]|uniref:Uncharacterized protein n=1 Tax=Litoreibacter arenae DSM 19593 TaxID=1123360 RepID=S9RGQ6_9RHOB|nr:hypothetical protein thalar_02992 [Litoreibacter arenae DSM 19593]